MRNIALISILAGFGFVMPSQAQNYGGGALVGPPLDPGLYANTPRGRDANDTRLHRDDWRSNYNNWREQRNDWRQTDDMRPRYRMSDEEAKSRAKERLRDEAEGKTPRRADDFSADCDGGNPWRGRDSSRACK
jgi:hypothetical protein